MIILTGILITIITCVFITIKGLGKVTNVDDVEDVMKK
jgi:hypothetical protein